jgi:phosphonate degradation associated HDIG domain protein
LNKLSNLQDIEGLYAARGNLNYGEGVTQMEHALQCASLAEADGAGPALIVAALLHDVGHLFLDEKDVAEATSDDRHEAIGARALAGLFPQAVTAPIALHVAAKRYLCFREPGYLAALSPASQRSLILQGGPFDAAGATAFEASAGWRDAVLLRRFDDTGKREEPSGRSFADYLPLMRGLLIA